MAVEVAAQIDRLFQCLQTHLAWLACFDVRFDLLAGQRVQFTIDIFGKPLEEHHAVLVIMVRIILFHSSFSVLP